MTIVYSDSRAVEAVLLSRTETTIRVAMEGLDDVVEFSNINGIWLSADWEPVRIEFAWQRQECKPTISEADCCCSCELAARLMQSLFTDATEERIEVNSVCNDEFGFGNSSGIEGTKSTAAQVPRSSPC